MFGGLDDTTNILNRAVLLIIQELLEKCPEQAQVLAIRHLNVWVCASVYVSLTLAAYITGRRWPACVHSKRQYQHPHLFVGGSASSYEHHVEACESHDRNKEKARDAHHHQAGRKRSGIDNKTTGSRLTVALLIFQSSRTL